MANAWPTLLAYFMLSDYAVYDVSRLSSKYHVIWRQEDSLYVQWVAQVRIISVKRFVRFAVYGWFWVLRDSGLYDIIPWQLCSAHCRYSQHTRYVKYGAIGYGRYLHLHHKLIRAVCCGETLKVTKLAFNFVISTSHLFLQPKLADMPYYVKRFYSVSANTSDIKVSSRLMLLRIKLCHFSAMWKCKTID